MSMGAGSSSGKVMSVNGIKPVPTQPLASATWQGLVAGAGAGRPRLPTGRPARPPARVGGDPGP
jgi:hypothetical protein